MVSVKSNTCCSREAQLFLTVRSEKFLALIFIVGTLWFLFMGKKKNPSGKYSNEFFLRLLLMLFNPGSGDFSEHPPKSQSSVV